MLEHLEQLYAFYGEHVGTGIARKHIGWYSKGQVGGAVFRQSVNREESAAEQLVLVREFFDSLAATAGLAA